MRVRRQHYDELEADFQQYYNLDVALLGREKVARLLFQLPKTSRIFIALQPANQWGWLEILLNKATYLLEVMVWQKANEGVSESKQTPKPDPFLPDFMKDIAKDPDIETHTTDEIRAILARDRV